MDTTIILDDDEYLVTTVALRRAIREIQQAATRGPLPLDVLETLAALERTYSHLKAARITSFLMPQILQN